MTLDEIKEFFSDKADFWVSPPTKYDVTLSENWVIDDESMADPETLLTGATLETENFKATPTVESLLALAGAFSLSRDLLTDTPSDLIAPVFNHHLAQVEEDKGPQFLMHDASGSEGIVAASMVHPFNLLPISHHSVFSVIAAELCEQGYIDNVTDVSVKVVHHTPNLTQALLLLPLADDGWKAGIYVTFSVSGRTSLTMSMAMEHDDKDVLVLDRWTFKHSPKKHGNTVALFTEWVEMTTAILGLEMSNEIEDVQNLKSVDIEEELAKVVQDVFTSVRMPMSLRSIVTDAVEHLDEASGYNLMMCVAAAQHVPGIKPAQRERVQRAAGLVGAVLGARCSTCHSLLPENIDAHAH